MRAAQGRAPPRRARSMAHVAPIIAQPFARPTAHCRPPPGQCLRIAATNRATSCARAAARTSAAMEACTDSGAYTSHRPAFHRAITHETTAIGRLDDYLAGNSCLAPTSFSRKPALHGRWRSKSTLSRLNDGFASGPMGPGPTDEHSVHPHHRDFIVTPIADQIGPIDSVSKTEYYDLKNHFSEPQCKLTRMNIRFIPITETSSIGYPRMSASGESSTTMHRILHASGSHPISPPDDPKTNLYNQDLGLIHSTNGNHLESPNEGSSIDHQVTIYLYAQNITMFPTNETWYFASQILVSSSGGLILILTAQSTRNMFRIHSDY
ncbi:hypothetical protein F511_22754 [Dorcoceras hygrometricum]|uniref:Uncharacterized protein n=1 Tax=Dorcoceras hygrometricum TaxID=472368 RepID=A0A2Z7DHY0_9LAMI|nr:hypothetical protein F511_22754 [Dorcoceras hygrometricum]